MTPDPIPSPVSSAKKIDPTQLKPTKAHRSGVRTLLRQGRWAALSTAPRPDVTGPWPLVSLVTYATDVDGSPLLLLSTLAEHTQALLANPTCSLLIEQAATLDNPQTGPRATLCGTVHQCQDPDEVERLRQRFLAIQPAAALYAGFGDFSFWRFELQRVHYVGGFARAVWIDDPQADYPLACDPASHERWTVEVDQWIRQLNDRFQNAWSTLAQNFLSLADLPSGDWSLTTLDAEGITVGNSNIERTFFIGFETPMCTPDSSVEVIEGMVEKALNNIGK